MSNAAKRQRQKENARTAREQTAAADRRSKQMRTARTVVIAAVLAVGAVVLMNSCSGSDSGSKSSATTAPATTPTSTPTDATTPTSGAPRPTVTLTGFEADPGKTYTANIVTNFGPIVITLDSKNAPKAAGRFIELARAGFYDGLTWHRVVPDFVIQGGDPNGNGTGGSGNPPVVGETPTDGYPIGSLAAAKGGNEPPGSFDSQFFIVTGQQGTSLPPDYARFGQVKIGRAHV